MTVSSRHNSRAPHSICVERTTRCFQFFHTVHLSTHWVSGRGQHPKPVASTLVSSRPPPALGNHQPVPASTELLFRTLHVAGVTQTVFVTLLKVYQYVTPPYG